MTAHSTTSSSANLRTSSAPWQEQIRQALRQTNAEASRGRVAVVGVGHDLRGDDAAGSLVARRLLAKTTPSGARTLILDGGCAPENHLGQIIRFRPDMVIFVDVAAMALHPGAIAWLGSDVIGESMTSTHTMSLSLSARFLRHETGCEVFLLGIQPLTDAFGEGVSTPVAAAVDEIVVALGRMLLP